MSLPPEVIKEPTPTKFALLKKRIVGINRLFLVTVLIPTIIATIYFGLIASDVYISESRFVIRSPQRQQSVAGLGALLQGAGFSRSQDDTYTVHDYMHSRDALHKLDEALDLKKVYSNSTIDIFSRFSAIGGDKSFEALYKYFQKMLGIELDTASSISTLKVSAYTADDAYRINGMLLEMGEALINKLNERGRQDMINFANTEVSNAEDKVQKAGQAMATFRKENVVFDPDRQTTLQFTQISKLQDELIASKTQLVQIRTFTADNPQIPALRKRIETLKKEIESEQNKVTGSGSSLTTKAVEFERLSLDLAFADKQLAGSLASLVQARDEAVRKQLYLERIVQPNKPDTALEPKRLRGILSTFVLGLLAWGICTILIAGVREHQD